jgi:hypothetical protein
MGIPVVEIDCGFHVNVHQKVPLNADRDNVTPAYLKEIQAATLNHMSEVITGDEADRPWINEALESPQIEVEAVKHIIEERYGDKVVISDPSDPEGTKMAVQQGYTVLPPRTFSHDAWQHVKAAGVLPAGKVTPSPKPYGAASRRAWSRTRGLAVTTLAKVRLLAVSRTIPYLHLAVRRPF